VTEEQNMLLARVEGTNPMGQMIRRFWLPVARSESLEADGAPRRVTLLGEKLVVFRATDGRVGLLDELCPHRRASLALAHNEDNGLRCIYHGWKINAEGRVVDIPTEPDPARCAALASRVPVRHFPVHEGGGLIWGFLGEGQAPPVPAFEFTTLPREHVDIRAIVTRANWLQTMEAILDTAHLGFLHRSSIMKSVTAPSHRRSGAVLLNSAPTLQVERTGYGLREAALRQQPDGELNIRIREYVAPIHVLIPTEPEAERQQIITVPATDTSSIQFIVTYNPYRPLTKEILDTLWFDTDPNADDIGWRLPGPEQNWGQDRAAMKAGHSSGLTNRHSLCEDIATLESMGPIVDRSREFLTHIDLTVATVRRELLQSLEAVARGEPAWGEVDESVDIRRLRSQVAMLPPESDWRQLEAFAA
jgi:nitrite reductase/ring-hydroxylating ferredoxin subunit